eukprot:CAMPEP_0201566436 /NCGR_PEP_ID=MMETSP0190_2-20130828/6179_1 /ASSEMBLY_ACC=CAM_ASM_000263 /TAXON_ID=37353 /ORGANISM="Rosalina sp." /LENGTH=527 /DNA_ID=CAMNT_0047985121 /DNA_START=49 /DNA_END=1632 /DNA_ORIENTATION=+
MAAETTDNDDNNTAYTPGVWLWDDPDHGGYTKFDDPTSNQIEDKLKDAIDKKTKGSIEVKLSAGPWFGLPKNKEIYVCVIIVDCTDPKRPVIQQARQTNTNSGYKRPIKRDPPLDPPLAKELQDILDTLQGKWEWKDDYGWKEYDLQTMSQIENSFQKKEKKVELSAGNFFSKQSGIYFIEFNYLSLPASAQQHNRKSHYGRWVRRIPVKGMEQSTEKKPGGMTEKQKEFFLKQDKHFIRKKHYAPLSIEDFNDQNNDETLKQNLKCSVCQEEFEEKDLIEKQNEKASEKKVKNEAAFKNDGNNDDEKNNSKREHKYDLSKAALNPKYLKDETIVGLKQCAYGHYFHANCILQALDANCVCPLCKMPYDVITGYQPEGRLYVTKARARCQGFNDAKDSIKMLFEFPGGIQNDHHPNPGKIYFGDLREAFLPNNKEGREAAMLTRIAFKRKLIFQIGTSLTLQQDNRIVFGSIHLKTSTTGGREKHGFPDDDYFTRFKDELKQKGITTALLTKEDHRFIDDGFPAAAQ